MKKLLLFSILLFTQCAVTTSNTKTDVKIQVLDEAQNPIKDFYISGKRVITKLGQRPFYTEDLEEIVYEITNSTNGIVNLPMTYADEYIYIGSKGYLGTIIQVTDTVIVLKKAPSQQ